jgi:GAF domain-containing protein
MADTSALIRCFADYAQTISRPYEVGEVLYRLTDQVRDVLDLAGAGVTLANSDGELQFVTATDDIVLRVEEQQVETKQGPCHDAFEDGKPILIGDLEDEERWPDYRPFALAQGCRAVAGIPMSAGEHRIGAVNLYHDAPREWPESDLEIARVLADMAAGYIINARTLSAQRELAGQLQHALDSRVIVEQAKGVLTERHRVDPAAAFQMIRQHARGHNARVHGVASSIVAGELRL